ncbi:MAG: RHS repeat-associated core domain-containing protein [Myxococcales bacterium]
MGPNFEVHDGVAVTYVRSGARRVARTRTSTLQTGLIEDPAAAPNPRIDVGDAWLASTLGKESLRQLYASVRRLLLESSPGTAYLHHDHLGSLSLATGAAAELRGQCAFHVVREAKECHGFVDSYGLTGQRHDPTTRFEHFPYRELDSRAGRWNSADPRFLRDGELCLARPFECRNGYSYVTNNPIDGFDPTGEAVYFVRTGEEVTFVFEYEEEEVVQGGEGDYEGTRAGWDEMNREWFGVRGPVVLDGALQRAFELASSAGGETEDVVDESTTFHVRKTGAVSYTLNRRWHTVFRIISSPEQTKIFRNLLGSGIMANDVADLQNVDEYEPETDAARGIAIFARMIGRHEQRLPRDRVDATGYVRQLSRLLSHAE